MSTTSGRGAENHTLLIGTSGHSWIEHPRPVVILTATRVERRPHEPNRVARYGGFAVGLSVVALALPGWRVAGGDAAPGAGVTVAVNRTGELAVAPAGRLISERGLTPGVERGGRFTVTNLTGVRLALGVAAQAPGSDLDELLAVRLAVRGRRLFGGTLGELRAGTTQPLMLAPGARVSVRVRVRLLSSAGARASARAIGVELVLRSTPYGG